MLKLFQEISFNSNMQKNCIFRIGKRFQILGSCRDTWSFYYAREPGISMIFKVGDMGGMLLSA